MFFLGDESIEFRRRKGSKDKKKRKKKKSYKRIKEKEKENYNRQKNSRDELNNKRKVVGTGIEIAKESRGWLNLFRNFKIK